MPGNRSSAGQMAPKTGTRLIGNAKEYLRQWLQGQAPDAYLTHQWEEFFNTYTSVLRGMARRFHLSREETDDILQEVWSEVALGLPKLQWQESGIRHGLRGWLYKLVRSKSIDCIRRRLRRPLELVGEWTTQEPLDPVPGLFDQSDAAWKHEWLCRIVAHLKSSLSDENHRLLTLRLVERRSLAEVAKALNLSKSQIKFRQNRMFRRLRGEFAIYRGVPFEELRNVGPVSREI